MRVQTPLSEKNSLNAQHSSRKPTPSSEKEAKFGFTES